MLAQLDRTGEDQISLTDPDSRAMAAHTHVAVGYNVQVAVDTKHKLIVEQQVTNQALDMGLLTATAEPAREVLGVERIAVVADRGYFKIEDIEACEKAGMEPYVPRPQRGPSVRAGLFRKDEFEYDPESDTVLCPGGPAPAALFVIGPARAQEDQLCQQAGVSGLPHPFAMHQQQLSFRVPPGERGRARPDARPAGEAPRGSRAPPRGGGASLRHDQTMDEPRRVPECAA